MKLLFLDTEFTNFIGTELISIGLVSEDGQEFYCEISDYNKKLSSQFVKDVVEPKLNLQKFGVSKTEASARLFTWLEELAEDHKICIDYDGDWELLLDLLEDLPGNIEEKPLFLNQYLVVKTTIKAHNLQVGDYVRFFTTSLQLFEDEFKNYFNENPDPGVHHALEDAKANKYGYSKVISWLDVQNNSNGSSSDIAISV